MISVHNWRYNVAEKRIEMSSIRCKKSIEDEFQKNHLYFKIRKANGFDCCISSREVFESLSFLQK